MCSGLQHYLVLNKSPLVKLRRQCSFSIMARFLIVSRRCPYLKSSSKSRVHFSPPKPGANASQIQRVNISAHRPWIHEHTFQPLPFLLPYFSSGFSHRFSGQDFSVLFLGHFFSYFSPSVRLRLIFSTKLLNDFLAETFLSVLRSAKVNFLAFSAKHFNSTHSALFFHQTFHRFSSRDFFF